MTHELLAQMDTKTAATAIERASTKDFESVGGLGSQLIEMRDKDPKAYMQIIKEASQLAGADNSGNKTDALHNLELVDELSHLQNDLKTGKLDDMRDDLAKLKLGEKSDDEKSFVFGAIGRGGNDAGLITRGGLAHDSYPNLVLHQPGSEYGLEITTDKAVAYNWATKQDDATNAKQVLDGWNQVSSSNDASVLQDASKLMDGLASEDAITQAMSPTFHRFKELLTIANDHGYKGKTGFEAVQSIATDITQQTGVDLKINQDSEIRGDVQVNVAFKNGSNLSSYLVLGF